MGEIIIASLATYGISSLLTEYSGIKDIFIKARLRFPNSALNCIVCTSVYVSIALFIIVLLGLGYYLTPFAVVGVVIILDRFL